MTVAKLATIAARGDRIKSLESLRDVLARAIDDDPPARDLAALSRQFTSVVAELAAVKPEEEKKVDEFTAKRAARRAKAAGPVGS